MAVDVPADWILALLLGSVRVAGWLVVAPPFAGRSVPGQVKALLSVALTLPLLPRLVDDLPPVEVGPVVAAAVVQFLVGAGLGFICFLLFAAFRTAGEMVDTLAGFAMSTAFDPTAMSQTSIIGRFQGMVASTLLLVTNGWLIVWHGFFRTFEILPLDATFDTAAFATAVTDGLSAMVLAAVQIAAPMLAVLFIADVGLGLATRIAPQLNAFALGFPVKILLTITLIGYTFVMLPQAVEATAERMGATVVDVAD